MLALLVTTTLIGYFGYTAAGIYLATALGGVSIGCLLFSKSINKKHQEKNQLLIEHDKFPATKRLMLELENYEKKQKKSKSLLRKSK